jgi:alcohol dehydrogenase class IV
MQFEFATATRIVFGAGTLNGIAALVHGWGRRALVVTGRSAQRAERLLARLREAGISTEVFPVSGEPTVHSIEQGVAAARQTQCDFVIGFGGGSAVDAGKAIAAMLTNPGEPLDYLEVIGRGRPIANAPAPFAAIPTTAGTGAEVTRNAVLASPEHRFKASLRSPLLLPRLAVVDPELTCDLPPAVTASTGLDALTQLIEPYVSCRANPMTDAVCVEGLKRAARALPAAFENGQHGAAREDMALASLFSGIALANAGLGAVHGFAAPIGGMFPAPHGAVCAALLPHVLAMNLRALRARAPAGDALRRLGEVARLLTGQPAASAEGGVQWASALAARFGIPKLSAYGIGPEHIADLVEKASKASSMKGNPIALTAEELSEVLAAAI